jgi:hypothetical protein
MHHTYMEIYRHQQTHLPKTLGCYQKISQITVKTTRQRKQKSLPLLGCWITSSLSLKSFVDIYTPKYLNLGQQLTLGCCLGAHRITKDSGTTILRHQGCPSGPSQP